MPMSIPKTVGDLEVLRYLGEGAFGVVYQVREPGSGASKAVKIPKLEWSSDEALIVEFVTEGEILSRIESDHVVTLYRMGEHEGRPFMVMDYFMNGSLGDVMGSPDKIGSRKALDYSLQIASGLADIHESGYIHRDIKPENVLIADDGSCVISDFGLAAESVKYHDTICGTDNYMPPEQLLGDKTDKSADIFSLGVVLYEMLAHRYPTGLYRKDLSGRLRSELDLPEGVFDIIETCLQRDPVARFQHASDFIRAVHEVFPTKNFDLPVHPKEIRDLLFEACDSFNRMLHKDPLPSLKVWPLVRGRTWFQEVELTMDLTPAYTYFEKLEHYAGFPRRTGEGYVFEAWVNSNEPELTGLYRETSALLESLISTDKWEEDPRWN